MHHGPAGAGPAQQGGFHGWAGASHGRAHPTAVTPRVRDALVLRLVAQPKSGHGRHASDASRAR